MLSAHQWVAVAAIAAAGGAAAWGGLTWARRRDAGSTLRHALALVQTLLIAQVALGLLLLADDRRTGDDLHYVYGSLALAAVLSPWFYAPAEPRPRLAWFSGASLPAALLAIRAYMTACCVASSPT
jgi:hypothetical protein